jgi:hypothetical protein
LPSVGEWLRFDESGPLLQPLIPMTTVAAKSPEPAIKNKRPSLIFIIFSWLLDLISNANATADFEIFHRLESEILLNMPPVFLPACNMQMAFVFLHALPGPEKRGDFSGRER